MVSDWDVDAEWAASGSDVAVCPSCGDRNPTRAKFCMECGARMTVDAGERRTVTVLFADLSGFTSYSETVDPEAVKAVAEEAANSLGDIVRRYGGTVDKIIGDCVMAIYGAPTSHEDDPERAVRSALDMHTFVEQHADRFAGLKLSIGVHTGEAIYAPVGPSGQYTVLGDTVNTAARLQSAANRGEVLIGEATARGSADAIDVEEIPPITAKGKQEPVAAWRAVGVKGTERTRRISDAPFIGRTTERARLAEAWERIQTDARAHLLYVVGAPGVGKTRLIDTFVRDVTDHAAVLSGRCLSYGEGITYWPITEIIRQAAGIAMDDAKDVTSKKLGLMLEGLGIDDLDQLRTVAVAVANLIGAPTTPRGTYTATEISKGELHWGIRRLLELLSARAPTLVLLDDLHWAEPSLLELLDYISASEAPARVLVVGSARPELLDIRPAPPADVRSRTLTLAPMSDDESRALLGALLTGEVSDRLAPLLRAADGNPLYMEEIVRMLAEEGMLDGDAAVGAIAVPDSLQSLIESRLDQLPREEKQVAGRASVVGSIFWTGAVESIGGTDIDPALRGLETRDIIRTSPSSSIAGQREYTFKHLMMRDIAYGRLPKADRARMHQACGDWIGALAGGADEYVELVAYHLEQACRLIRQVGPSAGRPPTLAAVTALTRAGEKSEGHEGTHEADRYYERALDILGSGYPETAAELRARRAETLAVLGDLDEAIAMLDSVVEDGIALDRDDLRARALLKLAQLDQMRSRADASREHIQEVMRLAGTARDHRLQVEAAFISASLRATFEGAPLEAIDELEDALELARGLPDGRVLRMKGHAWIGNVQFNIGDLAGAESHFAHAAELAAEEGSIRWGAVSARFLGTIRYYRGPRDDAEQLSRQALDWLERTPDRYIQIQTLKRLAILSLERGDAAAAEATLREALTLAEPTGGWLLVDVYRYLAATLCHLGRIRGARTAADAARDAMPENHLYARAAASLAAGYVATAEGDREHTLTCFDDALSCLEQEHLPLDIADTQVTYARALAALGDPDGAARRYEDARARFEQMGADAMVASIDAERAVTAHDQS